MNMSRNALSFRLDLLANAAVSGETGKLQTKIHFPVFGTLKWRLIILAARRDCIMHLNKDRPGFLAAGGASFCADEAGLERCDFRCEIKDCKYMYA